MFSLFGLLLCLLWCAVDIVAVNRGFGLNTKQSIIAGMSLFAVQMIGALCVGVAVALIAEPIVRHFFGIFGFHQHTVPVVRHHAFQMAHFRGDNGNARRHVLVDFQR